MTCPPPQKPCTPYFQPAPNPYWVTNSLLPAPDCSELVSSRPQTSTPQSTPAVGTVDYAWRDPETAISLKARSEDLSPRCSVHSADSLQINENSNFSYGAWIHTLHTHFTLYNIITLYVDYNLCNQHKLIYNNCPCFKKCYLYLVLFGGLPNEEEKSKINLSKSLFDIVPLLNYSRKHKRPTHKQTFCIEKHNLQSIPSRCQN